MGWSKDEPENYRLVAAARYLGVNPWDLARMPGGGYWIELAIAISNGEELALIERHRDR